MSLGLAMLILVWFNKNKLEEKERSDGKAGCGRRGWFRRGE